MPKFISIIVDTNAMINFFKSDSRYGTQEQPYIADHFITTDAPQAIWKGAKILVLEPKTEYRIQLISSANSPSVNILTPNEDDAAIVFTQISDQQITENDWEKIFDLESMNAHVNSEGKLVVKETESNTLNFFSIQTNEKITIENNLQYNILFKFGEPEKFAVIDPYIENTTGIDD
ncbi:hypothetical protein EMN47_10900 [Prolixibacteraceae bacterium JC049]|nr:hypothetical protein [Prolixibacteraceae bacterium JC049]